MTHILFCHGATDRLRAAAAWLEQIFAQSQPPIVIHTPDETTAARIDQLLWSASPTGFLPHCRAESPLAEETPILIVNASTPGEPASGQYLLNLGNDLPPDYARFSHLIEIISQEDEVRLPARNRAKTYRDQGHEVQFRDLQKEPL